MRLPAILSASLLLSLAACASIGPATIPRDRFDYGEAISNSWKQQVLLAIVKIRYLDMPMFVDVSSVINQYALEGDVRAGISWGGAPGTIRSVGGNAKFADRPTITYSPVVGRDFTESLMTPVPPAAVLFLVQSGWPVDFVFRLCVQAVNGMYNRGLATSLGRDFPDEHFDEVLEGFEYIQRSGDIGLRVESIAKGSTAMMVIRRRDDPLVAEQSARVRDLLGVSQDAEQFRVSYGSDAIDETNVAMLTRSLFEILIELARQVSVPEIDIEEGRTLPFVDLAGTKAELIRIHHGSEMPDDAFVTVRYRDLWFWINDRDVLSKRTFAFVMIIFNLTKTGSSAVPLLTVGT